MLDIIEVLRYNNENFNFTIIYRMFQANTGVTYSEFLPYVISTPLNHMIESYLNTGEDAQ